MSANIVCDKTKQENNYLFKSIIKEITIKNYQNLGFAFKTTKISHSKLEEKILLTNQKKSSRLRLKLKYILNNFQSISQNLLGISLR